MPVPAAIANALEAAIGARLRQLPLTPERVLDALLEIEDASLTSTRHRNPLSDLGRRCHEESLALGEGVAGEDIALGAKTLTKA